LHPPIYAGRVIAIELTRRSHGPPYQRAARSLWYYRYLPANGGGSVSLGASSPRSVLAFTASIAPALYGDGRTGCAVRLAPHPMDSTGEPGRSERWGRGSRLRSSSLKKRRKLVMVSSVMACSTGCRRHNGEGRGSGLIDRSQKMTTAALNTSHRIVALSSHRTPSSLSYCIGNCQWFGNLAVRVAMLPRKSGGACSFG